MTSSAPACLLKSLNVLSVTLSATSVCIVSSVSRVRGDGVIIVILIISVDCCRPCPRYSGVVLVCILHTHIHPGGPQVVDGGVPQPHQGQQPGQGRAWERLLEVMSIQPLA